VLIRDWDLPADDAEWRAFVAANAFGHLVAGGRDREVPVVVPTQFVLDGDQVVLHLATPNPIWGAIEENPTVLLSVAGDWTYIPSDWKAIGDEDPRRGVPTTYYAAAQLIGRARVVEEPAGVAEVLRAQLADLQPDVDAIDPEDHGAKLRAIRGLRIEVTEVRAKFKYGANVDRDHRSAVRDRLVERDGPGDRAAARHVERRL
jgi:transcriptional regulator